MFCLVPAHPPTRKGNRTAPGRIEALTSEDPTSSGQRSTQGMKADSPFDLPRDAESSEDWIAAMVANPRVIQRPIIPATDGTAVIARAADTLASVIEQEMP